MAHHSYTDATAYKLSANATDLSTTDATTLEGITGFDANGHTFTVLDTAANLVAHHSYTDATAYKLSANATDLSTTDATTLEGITGFDANGHTFTVLDTAANLVAHHSYTNATAYKLSANATETATDAHTLIGLTGFDANSHLITVNADGTGSLDFSSFTGSLAIIGDANANTIAGGAGADQLTGGAGVDTFVFATGDSTLANMDTITDYRAAGGDNAGALDLIDLTGVSAQVGDATGVVFDSVTDFGPGTTLAQTLDAVASANSVNNGTYVFTNNGDTYVYIESAGGANTYQAGDTVIKIIGTPWVAGTDVGTLGVDGIVVGP